MRALVLGLVILSLGACATIHEGQIGKVAAGDEVNGMVVSAAETGDPRNTPFSVFTVTIENTTNDWIRIDSVELEIHPTQADKISVVLGDDLSSWAEAMSDKAKMDDYNSDLLKLGLYTVGSVAAIVGSRSGSPGLVAAGGGVVVGTAAVDVTQRFIKTRNGVVNAASIPEKHLYKPFSVPGKLFVRKWILVNKPVNEALAVLGFQIKTVDGKTTHINVPICRSSTECYHK